MKLIIYREYRMGDEFSLKLNINKQKYQLHYGKNIINLNSGKYEMYVSFLWFKSEVYYLDLINEDSELVCGLRAIDVNFNYSAELFNLFLRPQSAFLIMPRKNYLSQIDSLYQD